MLKPGDTVGHYSIEAQVGQGGMGRVYRAHDRRLERKVAVKVIDESAGSGEAKARLLREARAAAALDHPNAVSIFDVGEVDDTAYIVMELVSGQTLRESVGKSDVPVSVRIGWLADVARALSAAHQRGLVHRDVKPENIMVREDGVVKVLDFGIARRAGARRGRSSARATQTPALATLTVEGAKLGTPVYMSPEHIRGLPLDGRADQFAWGVVAYELFVGRLPWHGSDDALAVVASILTDSPDRPALLRAGASTAVADVILRALAKKPEDRFPSMEELLRALDDTHRPSAAPPRGATTNLRFDTKQAKEVLSQAVDRAQEHDGKYGYDNLVEAAREVGVDPAQVRAASRDLRDRTGAAQQDLAVRREQEAWMRRVRRKFFRHFGVYLIVNTALVLIGILSHAGVQNMLFPAVAWGIGLAIHGMRALTANEDDFAVVQAKERRKESRRQKREAFRQNFIPPRVGARIAPPTLPVPAPARMRVGAETERTAAAEREAAAVHEVEEARRRRPG